MTDKRLENIKQMELLLTELDKKMSEAEAYFIQWKEVQNQFKTLVEYYHSPQWIADYEASNNGEFPKEISCGVLSEDAIYDLISRRYQWAISNLKVITNILDNE